VIGTDPTAVYNGSGSAQTWFRLAPLPSPDPYSCATAPTQPPVDPLALARYCRQHPAVPACQG
jgi:hypothetical protein